jgi:hypothetical protein
MQRLQEPTAHQNLSALWCAATLVRRTGHRVTVVVPRAAGVVPEARRAARNLGLGVAVAITASSVSVRLEAHG